MKAWVGKHNGLPCFYSSSPLRVVASDGRILDEGKGAHTLVADALAVPGAATTYTVGGSTVTLRRASHGHQIMSTLSGRSAGVVWIGDDEQTQELVSRVGRATRWRVGEVAAKGVLRARTHGAAAAHMLRSVLDERAPLVAVHSPAACAVPACDVPPVRVVVVSELTHTRTGRVDVPTREWQMPYETLPSSRFSGGVPVLTWDDWRAHASGGRWHNTSIEGLLRAIGGMS